MNILRKRAFHPYLLSAFPVLALLANNLTQVKPAIALRPLLAAIAAAGLLTLAFRLVFRDGRRAAAAASLMAVLFFSYGHAYNALKETEALGVLVGRHRHLAPLWLGLLAAGLWGLATRVRNPGLLTETLNVMAALALVLPGLQIARFTLGAQVPPPAQAAQAAGMSVPDGRLPPDIYYLVLDAYTREDVLARHFGYDNRPFLDALESMGFYVATCSQSNYAQTELSLSSSLNFDHHEALAAGFPGGNTDVSYLPTLIKRSAVQRILSDLGYTIVAFETGYYWSHLETADVYITPPPRSETSLPVLEGLNSFEVMLANTTGALILTDAASVLPSFLVPDTDYPFQRHRERVLHNLDALPNLPLAVQSPKFVFAHLIIPHEPFVFGPNGEPVSVPEPIEGEAYRSAYQDQITYLNRRLETLLAQILATSARPPIVVLQGDHGAGHMSPEGRMAIFNAYFLPEGGNELLYASISPVNTFRVIFNHYFDADLPLLDDTSYYSWYPDRFDFETIPNTCPLDEMPLSEEGSAS